MKSYTDNKNKTYKVTIEPSELPRGCPENVSQRGKEAIELCNVINELLTRVALLERKRLKKDDPSFLRHYQSVPALSVPVSDEEMHRIAREDGLDNFVKRVTKARKGTLLDK